MKRIFSIAAAVFALVLVLSAAPLSALAQELPDWYPDDPASWVFTPAGEDEPRLVDNADIFSDEEEIQLEQRMSEISLRYEADIVVYTDMTTYGIPVENYTEDFYDYKGFGYNEGHDGLCLFVLMDPADRQWWSTATGRIQPLYTEDILNSLDDILEPRFISGNYALGVYEWLNGVERFLDKGSPNAPDWFPSNTETFTRFHDASASRVVDIPDILGADEERLLAEKAKAISDKYGIDVALLFSNTSNDLDRQVYSDLYYLYNGYGFGEGYDGILATFFTGSGKVLLTVSGSAVSKLNDRNMELLIAGAEGLTDSEDFYRAGNRYLDYLEKTLRTGRTPRTPLIWVIRVVIASVVALIVSTIVTASAKASMKTIRTAYEADSHLLRDTLSINNTADDYTHSTTTRVYSPVSKDNSSRGGGSSSGGRSTYSGGHTGSSGTTHSGGGRHFR